MKEYSARALTYPAPMFRPVAGNARPLLREARRGARRAARLRPIPRIVFGLFVVFVATIPFEAANVGFDSGYFSVAKLSGLAFFAGYFFYFNPVLGKRNFPAVPAAMYWFLGYIGVYAIHGLFIGADLLPGYLSLLATILQLLIVFWVCAGLLKNEAMARAVLLTFVGASFLLAIAMLLHLPGFSTALETKAGERITSLAYNPNVLATVMALAAITLVGLRVETLVRHRWSKVLPAVLMLPLLGAVVRSGSRAGMLACALGFAVFLLPRRRHGQPRKATTVLFVLLVTGCLAYLVVTSSMALVRLQDAYEGNLSGRDKITAAAVEMVYEKPLLGWQPVALWQELGRRVGRFAGTRDAHNLFLHLLLEVGIVGTAPFLVGLGLCLRCAWKSRAGPLGVLPLALFLAMMSANLSHTLHTRKPLWLVLALCIAAYENMRHRPAANISPALSIGARRGRRLQQRGLTAHSFTPPPARPQPGMYPFVR
jgi:O-antigen ligase